MTVSERIPFSGLLLPLQEEYSGWFVGWNIRRSSQYGIHDSIYCQIWLEKFRSSRRKELDNFQFVNLPFERGEILFSKGFFYLHVYSQTTR